MREQSEQLIEPKSSRDSWSWMYWFSAAIALYVLASGPTMALYDRSTPGNSLCRAIRVAYSPLGWVYLRTALHKPLGMYWHLWDSAGFDKAGDAR
jgi:hypothetical protein